MAVKYISDQNPDGSTFGTTTSDLISFYGVTPVDQAAGAAAAGTTNATTTSPWGFATSTQANGISNLVNVMRTCLVDAGLMAAS